MSFLSNLFKGKPEEKKRFPPIPKWRPNTPVDYEKIVDRAKYYTGAKLQLAVFENGTVAFFSAPVSNIEEEAKISLNNIYNSHPDVKPSTMDDGNYLIEYSYPAFTIVFKNDLDNFWDYIEENHMQGICTDEVLINGNGEHNVFDRMGKICLFGRSKMFMDAQEPKIVMTFNPIANK